MTEYDYDYEDLDLVIGLEIHQQLDTKTKLFCGYPTDLREPDKATCMFTCFLHLTKGELGKPDDAVLEESYVERESEYLAYDSICLIEEDDKLPCEFDHEARTVATQIAELLDMNVVDEAYVMRKPIIGDSNTSRSQRLPFITQEGEIQIEDGPAFVVDPMFEEGSVQRVEERDDGVLYSPDRLGASLAEIGVDPDISSPKQTYEVAQIIGMLLRSIEEVRRGLGIIRQDMNVSIIDGVRVKIKGMQAFDQIGEIVRFEAGRQAELVETRDELQSRDASVGGAAGVIDMLEDSNSDVVRDTSDAGGKVVVVPLYGLDSLVGRELQPGRRLGTELSDHAKCHGAGGIFHTDELPVYGVTGVGVESLCEAVDVDSEDAVVIVTDDPEITDLVIDAVVERVGVATEEVPEGVHGANDDGTTRYLHLLPGATQVYFETGIPPVNPDPSDVEMPEPLTKEVDRYQTEFGFGVGFMEQIAYGRTMPSFEEAVNAGIDTTLMAGLLGLMLAELRRDDAATSELTDDHSLAIIQPIKDGDLAKGGVSDVPTTTAEDPSFTAEEAVGGAGLFGVFEEEVREAIAEVVECSADQVKQQDMGVFLALMGGVMGAFRGKADGGVVSGVLREEIQKQA